MTAQAATHKGTAKVKAKKKACEDIEIARTTDVSGVPGRQDAEGIDSDLVVRLGH